MIRLIFVALFVVLFLIIGIPVLGIEWLIGKISKKTMDYSSLRIVQWAFKVIVRLAGIELTVIGEENVPDEPVLFIGNHRSYFDIVITYARCKNLTGYIAKKEMLSIPLLRTWMKRLYCLFLDRENPKEGLKTILQAIDYVKHGVSICIFPEGTRNNGEELSLLPFHNGSFKIAEKTGFSRTTVRRRLEIAKLDRDLVKEKTDEDGAYQLNLKDLAQNKWRIPERTIIRKRHFPVRYK